MLKNRALTYIITVYVLTALYSLLYLKFPMTVKGTAISPGFFITMGYMLLPLIASLILQLGVYKEPLREIKLVFKWSNWYIVAGLLPFAGVALSFVVSLLIPGVTFSPDMSGFLDRMSKAMPPEQFEKALEQFKPLMNYMLLITIGQALVAGFTINALFAFGEEMGWRGFFLSALSGKNFYVSSVIIGLVWGFWHAPVILQGHNYPDHPLMGVFMMTVFTILLSPFLSYVVLKSGSVLAAAFMHGVVNACGGISIMYIRGGDDLTVGMTGASGLIALLILNVLLYLYDRFLAKERIINI